MHAGSVGLPGGVQSVGFSGPEHMVLELWTLVSFAIDKCCCQDYCFFYYYFDTFSYLYLNLLLSESKAVSK